MKILPKNKYFKSILKIVYLSVIIALTCFIYLKLALPFIEKIFQPNEAIYLIIKRLGLFAVFVFTYWKCIHFLENRRVTEIHIKPIDVLFGAISGLLLISITIIILFSLNYYQIIEYKGFGMVIGTLGILLILAIAEEFIFRGILFQFLEQSVGTKWSLAVVSLLFGVLHLFNDGAGLMTLFSGTLISALWTLMYIKYRNLWVIGIHHAFWNIAIFLSGIPLSGNEKLIKTAPLKSTYHGPELLTGGAFGPENSIITIIVGLIALFIMLKFVELKRLAPEPNIKQK